METFSKCDVAINNCLEKKRFTIANLHGEQKALDMHIHDCYEIYYSLSNGNQFFIDNKTYTIEYGDIFLINNYETHHVFEKDKSAHERIVLSIHPEMLARISTPQSDLTYCFSQRTANFSNKISLGKEDQGRFIFLLHKIMSADGYASDVIEDCAFTELMVMINAMCQPKRTQDNSETAYQYNGLVVEIMNFINTNIANELTTSLIAKQFFLSDSHVCRVFKAETGTTVHKYITARRISIAKSFLANGQNVASACELSGFNDYSNFVKMFTQIVGISPKKYALISLH